jgi:hypothetical protein
MSTSEDHIKELHEQIIISHNENSCDIEHPVFGGSLTVYRPQRDWLASPEKSIGPAIRPGYINASSWNTAGLSPKKASDVHDSMLVLLGIWEIAIEVLNRYNSVLADWEPLPNPIRENEDNKKWRWHYHQKVTEQAAAKKGKRKKA